MTLDAIFSLLLKKIHYLLAGLAAGMLVGYSVFLTSPTTYEGKTFVSIGTKWVDTNASTPAWDATQATEDFAETLIGIIKGSDFSTKLEEKTNLKNVSCSASTFEKSNVIITCGSLTEKNAKLLSENSLILIKEIIKDYNAETSTFYAVGYSSTSAYAVPPSLMKNIAGAGLAGFLMAIFLVLLRVYINKTIWHKSQVENLFGKSIAEIEHEILEKISQEEDILFVGNPPSDHQSPKIFPQDFDKNNQTITFVIDLNSATYNDLIILQNIIEESNMPIKLFTLR